MLVLAGLGLDPWDVLHQGLSRTFGLGIGTLAILLSLVVLVAWWPLRLRPGGPARLRENLAAAELVLTEADMDRIAGLDRGYRLIAKLGADAGRSAVR
jgi:hypothetical protein